MCPPKRCRLRDGDRVKVVAASSTRKVWSLGLTGTVEGSRGPFRYWFVKLDNPVDIPYDGTSRSISDYVFFRHELEKI